MLRHYMLRCARTPRHAFSIGVLFLLTHSPALMSAQQQPFASARLDISGVQLQVARNVAQFPLEQLINTPFAISTRLAPADGSAQSLPVSDTFLGGVRVKGELSGPGICPSASDPGCIRTGVLGLASTPGPEILTCSR